MDSPLKWVFWARESKVWHCCLNSKILNILYDRHSPNPGFWFLMTFEHLNSNT